MGGIVSEDSNPHPKLHPGPAPALAPRFPAAAVGPPPEAVAAAALKPARRIDYDAQQAIYLTASGTLTQFNAIMAAGQTAALTAATGAPLKIAAGVALLQHSIAAFLLCWAARPLGPDNKVAGNARDLANDTFHNYRRGWRATLFAMAFSAFALVIFLWESAGLPSLRPLIGHL